MATNNSSTGGFITSSVTPLDDGAFDDFLHDFIQGLTSLDGTLIRPLWQQEPPSRPDININWVAFGITNRYDDYSPSSRFDDSVGMISTRYQEFELQLSFYGPQAASYEATFRDNIEIAQNREYLLPQGVAYVGIGMAVNATMEINTRYELRIDVITRFRRQLTRIYPILSLLSAEEEIVTPTYSDSINTTN